MADKYYRLVCFVVNICPEPLREFFIKLANKDAGSSYTTVDAYLAHRQWDVVQLKMKKSIREDQYDLLYPIHGTANLDQWDITLLVTLITEMFGTSIQQHDIYFMKNEIRGIRNELQHLPNTSNMTDEDFDSYWERLDTAAMTIAKQVFSAEREELFRKKIENAKCNNLPNLGDSLRQWYEEIIKQVQSNTKETTSILRQVTVQKPGPSGDKNKRIKTADGILAKLQASFEATMKELPDSFNAPSEVADIRTKLRDNHYVVVTGSYNSRYFDTALAAIKGMDYNYKRSVEMHKSSDWRHIDPEDVDFVLCRDPFGSFSYDKNKAKGMEDIFNSMMHTTNGDENKTLDLVIVTDLTILTECKKHHDHDILEEIVKVFDDTSESRPADLTLECRNQNMTSNCFSFANNLGVLTSNFLKQYSISSSQVNESIMKEARDKFKAKKAIVLTGPRKCGKTSVAVALASSYQPSQCSLLTEPYDFKTIDFQNICLIIIDEFAGKYCYDKKKVYNWFSMFDHLYNAITAGQMNVIITCEKSKLDKSCTEISSHPVLDHRVDMQARTTVIKQEMELQNTEQCKNENMTSNYFPVANNLGVLTSNFLKQYSISSSQVNESVIKEARDKCKAKKAIVLTGPRKCGKTSVAVALASSYQPSQCSLLTEPSDFKKIDLQNICLIIIDEFAGKYCYDKKNVYKWYSMFDHLYNAITAGQMNVIITCEKSKLDKCCDEISSHPVLDHRIDMPARTTVTKQYTEHTLSVVDNPDGSVNQSATMKTSHKGIAGAINKPYGNDNPTNKLRLQRKGTAQDKHVSSIGTTRSAQHFMTSRNLFPTIRNNNLSAQALSTERGVGTGPLSQIRGHQRETHNEASIAPAQRLTGPHVWSVKEKHKSNTRVKGDGNVCDINGCCLLPSGEILLADLGNCRLKKLDARLKVISVCDMPAHPNDVCYIGNNVAVVALFSYKLQFVDTRGNITLTRSVDTDHSCWGLTYGNNQLYFIDASSVYIYSKDGIKQRTLYTHKHVSTSFRKIALSDDGSLIYISNLGDGLVIIDSSGKHLFTFTDSELIEAGGVCVDGEGHVLVYDYFSNKILQLSSDGKKKLGIISQGSDYIDLTKTLCFDKENTTLLAAGYNDNIRVLKLQ